MFPFCSQYREAIDKCILEAGDVVPADVLCCPTYYTIYCYDKFCDDQGKDSGACKQYDSTISMPSGCDEYKETCQKYLGTSWFLYLMIGMAIFALLAGIAFVTSRGGGGKKDDGVDLFKLMGSNKSKSKSHKSKSHKKKRKK